MTEVRGKGEKWGNKITTSHIINLQDPGDWGGGASHITYVHNDIMVQVTLELQETNLPKES